MTDIAAVSGVGERVAALLRTDRDAGAAAGALGGLPATFDVVQLSARELGSPPEGLSITCYHIAQSHDRNAPQVLGRDGLATATMGLELHFLVTAWSSAADQEQALIAWAMQAFARDPVLTTPGSPDVVRLTPANLQPEAMFEVWRGLGWDYRLSFVLIAGGLRLPIARLGGSAAPVLTRGRPAG